MSLSLLFKDVEPTLKPPIEPVVALICPDIVAPVAVITPDEDTVKFPEPIFISPAVIEPKLAEIADKLVTSILSASIVPEVILSASKLVTVITEASIVP